ncbi:MAG TPA: YggS family pyridoxal phosphate-dependent enzyme [Verrucomicrobiales bacterium]|nr:YggS family pyridoxal phosphate-dependent enzyme [Verrucomicrobiales bacterium]HIL72171.1 YggS family pyridoxal phosphate-dependent enzyme [Verrucomicrobiota bacterium]
MSLIENLEKIQIRIEEACGRAERPVEEVTLMAVSKGQTAEAVREAMDAGLTLFGENRIQEALLKRSQCSSSAHWHLIGHLQTNKAKDAVRSFEMIHSVDSVNLAQKLNSQAEKLARSVPILLQVNIGGESSKFGLSPELLISELPTLNQLMRLEIHGLMIIPPWSKEPEEMRTFFRRLRELKTEAEQILQAPLSELSMGMSNDFEVAIEEGATTIRVGTALFGPRKPTKAQQIHPSNPE